MSTLGSEEQRKAFWENAKRCEREVMKWPKWKRRALVSMTVQLDMDPEFCQRLTEKYDTEE